MSDDVFRVALPIAGGAIGFVLGAPAIGFIVGSVAAQLLFPPDPQQIEQPLITDWKLSDSGLGVDLPYFVAGNDRLPGLLTYHGGVDVVTTVREESSGGKGGQTTEITEHAYFATFSVIGGQVNYDIQPFSSAAFPELTFSIRRIWMGGTLVYDASANNTGAVSKYGNSIFPRLGGESQVAHSSVQAAVGINRAPAYRGRPGVDFVRLPLADFANSAFPAPSFELVFGPMVNICTGITDGDVGNSNFAVFNNSFMMALTAGTAPAVLKKINLINNTVVVQRDLGDFTNTLSSGIAGIALDHQGNVFLAEDRDEADNTNPQHIVKYDFDTLEKIGELEVDLDDEFGVTMQIQGRTPVLEIETTQFTSALTGEKSTLALYVLWSRSNPNIFPTPNDFSDMWIMDPETLLIRERAPIDTDGVAFRHSMTSDPFGFAYLLIHGSGIQTDDRLTMKLYKYNQFSLIDTIALRSASTVFADFEAAAGMGQGDTWQVDLWGYDDVTNGLIFTIKDASPITTQWVVNLSADDGSLQGVYDTGWSGASDTLRGIHPQNVEDGIALLQRNPTGSLSVDHLDLTTMSVLKGDFVSGSDCPGIDTGLLSFYDPVAKSYYTNEVVTDNGKRVFVDRVDFIDSATVGDAVTVVLDQNRSANPLPQTLPGLFALGLSGYSSRRQTTKRGILEPIARDRGFDLIESGGKIKSVLRGAAPTATLVDDDLGAASGNTDVPAVQITRAHSQNLPARVDFKYRSEKRDYDIATQPADFPEDVITSGATVSVSTPINTTDQQAADIAQRIIDTSHIGDGRVSVTTFPEFLRLDPGDVIAVPIEGESVAVFIEKVTIGANRLVEIEGVTDDPAGWTQTAIPLAGDDEQFFDGTIAAIPPPVRLYLIDVALFRDQDDSIFGPYMAVAPYMSGGNGALVYRNIAGGDSVRIGSVGTDNFAIAGDTITALPDTTLLEVLDDVSTVDVRLLHSGMSLSSVSETQALNGVNAALFGNEVAIFRTATQLTDTTWRLSNFYRAERGTDWAVAGHAAVEDFVLLTPQTLIRPALDISQTGVEYFYRAVPFGGSSLDIPTVAFTWNALEKKPLSPIEITSQLVSGDKQVDWLRRSRVGGDFVDGVDIPIGEDTLEFQIDVHDNDTGRTVLNTYTVNATTWLYTTTEYANDFGLSPTSVTEVPAVDITIYQMSAVVGRGYPKAAIV